MHDCIAWLAGFNFQPLPNGKMLCRTAQNATSGSTSFKMSIMAHIKQRASRGFFKQCNGVGIIKHTKRTSKFEVSNSLRESTSTSSTDSATILASQASSNRISLSNNVRWKGRCRRSLRFQRRSLLNRQLDRATRCTLCGRRPRWTGPQHSKALRLTRSDARTIGCEVTSNADIARVSRDGGRGRRR